MHIWRVKLSSKMYMHRKKSRETRKYTQVIVVDYNLSSIMVFFIFFQIFY